MKSIMLLCVILFVACAPTGLVVPEYVGDDAATILVYQATETNTSFILLDDVVVMSMPSPGAYSTKVKPGTYSIVMENYGIGRTIPRRVTLQPQSYNYFESMFIPLVVRLYLNPITGIEYNELIKPVVYNTNK